MQKQRCHEFAAEKGWDIIAEFSEKGVSGFKVSAKDRDAVQEIQRDAAMGKFDILLVFMFDRLGRKEDETPFVVEWFVNNGIEVWSAEEGQQRFDNHVDKLMNYIRYWQASGESLKTSIRTKTRLGQIVQEGRFRGGTPAYGYQLVKKGRTGKKNRELYDIEINPDEAFAVKRMFDLTDRYGYGGRKISTILKNEGIVNLRTGEPFHYSTIQHILANIMNAGILRSGETQSEVFPELQIIPLEQFQRVAKAREQRSVNYAIKCGWEPETVADYILNGRPDTAIANIFLCHTGVTRPLDARSASAVISRHMKQAGVPAERRAFHALRRTFGTRLLQNEVSLELIQQLLGHRDMNSMKPYLSIDEQGLKMCSLPLLFRGEVGGRR